jgi:hypothetical protein
MIREALSPLVSQLRTQVGVWISPPALTLVLTFMAYLVFREVGLRLEIHEIRSRIRELHVQLRLSRCVDIAARFDVSSYFHGSSPSSRAGTKIGSMKHGQPHSCSKLKLPWHMDIAAGFDVSSNLHGISLSLRGWK